MSPEETATALLWLTHSWQIAPPSTAEHLVEAQKTIALALLGDQTELLVRDQGLPAPVDVDPAVSNQIQFAVAAALADLDQTSLQPRVFIRSLPILTHHDPASVPLWAAGLAQLKSLGPFVDDRGFHYWVDSYEPLGLSHYVTFARPDENFLFLLIPVESQFQSAELIEVGRGTVWIHDRVFDTAAPDAYVGLRIHGGFLRLDGPITSSDPFLLDPQGSVELTLDLDPPPQTGPGATRVKLPQRVKIHIAPAGVDAIETADLSLELEAGAFTLHRGEERPRYERTLNSVVIPFESSRDRLNGESPDAALYKLQGNAAVVSGAWTLPVTETPAGLLGEASGIGALALALAPGLTATWRDLTGGPIRLNRTFVEAAPGLIAIVAPAAENRRNQHRVLLWREPDSKRRSCIEAMFDKPHALTFLTSHEGIDVVLASATVVANLDRPLHANGSRPVFRHPNSAFRLVEDSAGPRVQIAAIIPIGISSVSLRVKLLSFAISNALLRTTPALALTLAGSIEEDASVAAGRLVLGFGLDGVLLTLSDPYAANVTQTPPQPSTILNSYGPFLLCRVGWTAPADPALSFYLAGRGDLALLESLQTDVALYDWRPERVRMLDVSSRADLFGVGFNYDSQTGGTVALSQGALFLRGLDLIAPIQNVSAFTLPAFQWEPVYNIPAEGALPFPDKVVSGTDGAAVQFTMSRTPTVSLIPVAPLPVAKMLETEYNSPNNPALRVRFTLPFGMEAVAELRRSTSGPSSGPHFSSLRPEFPKSGLSGGMQLTLGAAVIASPSPGGPMPGLPGRARQGNNITGGIINVLEGGNTDDIFNATFDSGPTRMVPVQRIDFSGYGASIFSDWRHSDVPVPGITQVKFQAIVGRTGREVVQVRSRLYPWGAIVVRTTTIERTGSGGMFRRDSGWQAASDGDYKLGPGCTVHSGVVRRLTHIRRIRDTTNTYQRVYATGAVKLTQVLFDADVEIEDVTLGANNSRLVPTCDIIGYVQVLPTGADLTAHQLDNLLIATGPIGGPIDCELNVAQSGLHMRLARIEVDRSTTPIGTPEFVAVARGTAELPSAGQWSFTYRGPSEPEPHRLEPNRPIPLIRANPVGSVAPPYRFADPRELHRPTNPDSDYGLLFSTGAQRMLVPQPQLRPGDATIHAGSTVLFADMYALGGGVALFPRPELCHPLPAGSALRITGRKKVHLDIPAQGPGLGASEFKVAPVERVLSQSAALRVRSRFRPDSTIKLVIDSDQRPDWSCAYGPVSVISDIEDLEEIMQVVGHMTSSAEAAPEMRDPHMVFGGPLAPVQAIISFLTDFGLPFPFFVSVTNTEYSFKTGTKYTFPPPGLDALFLDDAIEDGLGLMLQLELVVGLGTETESLDELKRKIGEHHLTRSKTVWHSHLEFKAKILVKAFELGIARAFLGGASKYEFIGRSDGTSDVALYIGFAGVVEVDLKILEISGGRSYSVVSRRKDKKLELGFASEYEVEGELLKGLVTVGLSFELLLLAELSGDLHLTGEATLAIDVTLGWVVSKSYEVEFQMSETLAAAAFVATTVLPIR